MHSFRLRVPPPLVGQATARDVNLAELGAIYVALCLAPVGPGHRDLEVHTDSACCMDMLEEGRRGSQCSQGDEHKRKRKRSRVNAKYAVLLEATLRLVSYRMLSCGGGGTVTFHKVRAHSGVRGNEEADRLARLATTRDDAPALWLPPKGAGVGVLRVHHPSSSSISKSFRSCCRHHGLSGL